MNILFVSHETVFGGATLSLLGMIDELKKENNVYVLVRQKRGPFIEQLRSKNVSVIYAKYYSWLIPQSRRGIKGKIVNLLHRVACGISSEDSAGYNSFEHKCYKYGSNFVGVISYSTYLAYT